MKIIILLLSILVISQCQVLGIDFGTEFWKASLISPGKNLVIVENSRSGRKTINGVAIMQGVRHFEDDALYKRLKKPHMSYFYLNKLLRSLDFPEPLPQYKYENNTYFITHEQQHISLEQLVGMILKNIKLHSINQAGSQIKDCVLAVPASWGWRARMALVNAAGIAGLNVLGLVNENSAAAINFAITRNDTDPINIGFFNLGSHNLQFSIMQFYGYKDQQRNKNIESLRVLSHIVVENVGGLSIDRAIADYLSEQFKKKHGLDPRKKEKAYVKLLHESSEAKETLSANKQVQVYVEGIMDGIDLNLPLTRQIIDSLPIFKQLNQHLDAALTKAGITKQQLNSVEMIGGASRIPLVSKIVKEHFSQIEVGSHINGDEAMAFGSALRAANLSIAFRVKELHFYDGFEQDVKCRVRSVDNNETFYEQQVIFARQQTQHGEKAYLHLTPPQGDIEIDLFNGQQLIKTYKSQNITSWQQQYNSSEYNFTTHPTLVLGFVLSTVNVVELKQGYVNLTWSKVEEREVEDWVEEDVQEEVKEEQQAEKENQQQNVENTTNTTQQQQTKNTTQQGQKKSKKLRKVTKTVQQQKIQTKKYPITTKQSFTLYKRFTKQQTSANQQILSKFETHEHYLRQKSKIRNDLESTLYRLRNSYEEPYMTKFSTQEELENLKKVVSQKLQWLDENAWTAEKDDFEKHFNHVFEAYSPMYNRSIQYNERQKKYNQTIQYLSFTYQKTLELNKTHSWLEDRIIEHLQKINSTVEHIHEKLKKQYDQQLNKNPLIYNNEMLKLAEQLRDQYYLMRLIPRPKKVQVPKNVTEQSGNKQQAHEQAAKSQENINTSSKQQQQAQEENAEKSQEAQEKQQNGSSNENIEQQQATGQNEAEQEASNEQNNDEENQQDEDQNVDL